MDKYLKFRRIFIFYCLNHFFTVYLHVYEILILMYWEWWNITMHLSPTDLKKKIV